MINKPPESWEYCDDLEMLYLFYQITDELLNEATPDTYSLPLHNPLSLVGELVETYALLKEHDSIDDYYTKYIPPIIDELLEKIKDDYLLKKIFDKRLDSVVVGFGEAKKNHSLLQPWVEIFLQAFSADEYRLLYQCEIINLVTETKDKTKLLYCVKNFYTALICAGYSQEYLYARAKSFFDNRAIRINSKNQIMNFFDLFPCTPQKHDFLILMDVNSIEYLDNISDNINIGQDIQIVDVEKERSNLCKDQVVRELVDEYDTRRSAAKDHQHIAIVRVSDNELDPYKSIIKFRDYISFLQTFKQYFVHHRRTKQVFTFLLQKQEAGYIKLDIPNEFKTRPVISQKLIDTRIGNVFEKKHLGSSAFLSLAHAIAMHADAIDSRDTSKVRSFWTALETLFSNPNHNSTTRDNVIYSALAIVQKTYILKIMRALYSQVSTAISKDALRDIGISDFNLFIRYFSANKEDSDEMKLIYSNLANNPLLRFRIFTTRRALGSGKAISRLLESHRKKIEWQLKRLYRIRNFSAHLGTEVRGANVAINHLHNYFDYIVNYMLCKSENGNFVANISALVLESKNDINIHMELLKSNEPLSEGNYMHYLFGPDNNLIKYQFEH